MKALAFRKRCMYRPNKTIFLYVNIFVLGLFCKKE